MKTFQKHGCLWVSLLAFLIFGFAGYQDVTFYKAHHISPPPTTPTSSTKGKQSPKVLLMSSAFTFGEVEWQSRLHAALANQGHSVTGLLIPRAYDTPLSLKDPRLWPLAPLGWMPLLLKDWVFFTAANHFLRPDLVVLSQAMHMPYFPQAQQAALISAPDVEPASRFFLLDYLLLTSDKADYCQFYRPRKNQSILLESYPSALKTDYKALAFKRIFFCGALWDRDLRASNTMKAVYHDLDDRDAISFFGPAKTWKRFTHYEGQIPFGSQAFEEKLQACGIGLCLHSLKHLESGTPTARIFELAAASSIILCDEHPFVKKHFKDNVLYINVFASAPEITAQIQKHLDWIAAHPEQAHIKARNAHAVFRGGFTMDHLAKRLIEAWQKRTHSDF